MKRRVGISDKLLRCFEQIQEDIKDLCQRSLKGKIPSAYNMKEYT